MARNARAPDPCTERRDRRTADSAPAQRTTATSMKADARRRFSALRRHHRRRGTLSHKGARVSHIRGPRMNYRLKYWLSTGRLSVRAFFVRIEVSWGQRNPVGRNFRVVQPTTHRGGEEAAPNLCCVQHNSRSKCRSNGDQVPRSSGPVKVISH